MRLYTELFRSFLIWSFSGDHNIHTHSGLSFKLCSVAYLYHLAKLRKHYCRRLLIRYADRRHRPTCKFSAFPRKHKLTCIVQVVQPPSLPFILFYGNSPAAAGIAENPSHSRVAPIAPPISFTLKPPISHHPRSNTPPTPALHLPPRLGHECAAHNVAYRPQGQGPRPGMSTCREHQGRHSTSRKWDC